MRVSELVEEVRELISIDGWDRLLKFKDQATSDFTLEVLVSLNFDHSYNDYIWEVMIRFHALGQYYSMSLMQFFITLGLYDRDYIHIKEYA